MLFDTLQSHKHVWIKKATGLGVTEFMLRYMAWLCISAASSANVQKNILPGSQMCIVTGPRIELAITLIDRMKGLFREASFSQNRALRFVFFKFGFETWVRIDYSISLKKSIMNWTQNREIVHVKAGQVDNLSPLSQSPMGEYYNGNRLNQYRQLQPVHQHRSRISSEIENDDL